MDRGGYSFGDSRSSHNAQHVKTGVGLATMARPQQMRSHCHRQHRRRYGSAGMPIRQSHNRRKKSRQLDRADTLASDIAIAAARKQNDEH